MSAGRSSVDIALYTLIPVMVVMMVMMKYLESVGVLAKLVNVVAPVLKPFGLTGLSLFALIQLNFVSFAAPVATLAMMEKKARQIVIWPQRWPCCLPWGKPTRFIRWPHWDCTGLQRSCCPSWGAWPLGR